jgi:hypothetical protein
VAAQVVGVASAHSALIGAVPPAHLRRRHVPLQPRDTCEVEVRWRGCEKGQGE